MTGRKEPLMRYKVQQDKGEYALKGCDDGDLVDYDEYAKVQRELKTARESLREAVGLLRSWREAADLAKDLTFVPIAKATDIVLSRQGVEL
jgi:hypothetical protein